MNDADDNSLGERLTWARTQAGLSPSQAAKLLGITREQIIAAENGAWPGLYAPAEAWSRAYDVDLQWLTNGDERPVHLPDTLLMDGIERESLRRLLARRRQTS